MNNKESRRRLRKWIVGSSYTKIPASIALYRRELAYLGGLRREAQLPSIYFYTVHKCASTFAPVALRYLNAKHLGLRQLDLAGAVWNLTSVDVYSWLRLQKSSVFRAHGYLYAPLREYIEPEDRHGEAIQLIMLRDPRDVLVSHYYSIAYSHNLPANPRRRRLMLDERSRVRGMTVGEYVHDATRQFRPVYLSYIKACQSGVPLLKYEDMIESFSRWANDLANALHIELSHADYEVLAQLGGFNVNVREDQRQHIRQRSPGDHRNKLDSSDQEILNERWYDVLNLLGYPV